MGFTNPSTARITELASINAPNAGNPKTSWLTARLGVGDARSLLIRANYGTASPGNATWAPLTIAYGIQAGSDFTQMVAETHFIADNGIGLGGARGVSDAVILSQVKGPFAQISMSGNSINNAGNLWVFGCDTDVDGFRRRDVPDQAIVGRAETSIPASQAVTTASLWGSVPSDGVRNVVFEVTESGGTGTITITPAATLYIAAPNVHQFNLVTGVSTPLGTVTGTATPITIGGTVWTAPLALPWLPAGAAFQLDLTYTLSAAASTRTYDVLATMY